MDTDLAKAKIREAILKEHVGKEVTLLFSGSIIYSGVLQEPAQVELDEPAQVDFKIPMPSNRWTLLVQRQLVPGAKLPTVMPEMVLEFTPYDDFIVTVMLESQREALDKLKEQEAQEDAPTLVHRGN